MFQSVFDEPDEVVVDQTAGVGYVVFVDHCRENASEYCKLFKRTVRIPFTSRKTVLSYIHDCVYRITFVYMILRDRRGLCERTNLL